MTFQVLLYEFLFVIRWMLNLALYKGGAPNGIVRPTVYEVFQNSSDICVFTLSQELASAPWNRKVGSDINQNLVQLAASNACKAGRPMKLWEVHDEGDWSRESGEETKGSTCLLTSEFITFLAFYPKLSKVRRLKQCLTLSARLRNLGCVVVFPLADPYSFAVNSLAILMSLIVRTYVLPITTLASNATLATGIPSLLPAVLPDEHLAGLPSIPWSDRSCTIMVATKRGGQRRKDLSIHLSKLAHERGLTTCDSGLEDAYRSYMEKVMHTRAYLNLNEVQDYYKRGRLVRFFPADMTTGRCYEAFAAGCLLVCNPTPLLEYLGFVAHQHFWPLPEDDCAWARLLDRIAANDSELRLIADRGRNHLHLLWANEDLTKR